MPRTLLNRLMALLLAISFVGGGFGLATADALVFHSHGQRSDATGAPHFDPPGGCGAHAEHCALSLLASLRQLASTPGIVQRFAADLRSDKVVAPIVAPRPLDSTNLQPVRAPPTAAS
jgi:hypothetical protein